MRAINLKKLATSLFIPLAVGFLSWFFTRNSMEVYAALKSPPLSPPGWVFPVVWTILFILMGIALYVVRCERGKGNDKKTGYWFFAIQLAVNFLWTIFFFNMGLYGFSAVWLGALIVLIPINMFYFSRVTPNAGLLLLPYLLWCVFALYLNIGIFVLN